MSKGQVSVVTCDAPSVNCNLREPRDMECGVCFEEPHGFGAGTANKKRPRKPRRGGADRPLKAQWAEAREISASIVPITLDPAAANEAVRSLGRNGAPWFIVNRLRHQASNYDALIKRHSPDVIKRRVLELIGERIPALREECERQAKRIRPAT